MSGNRRYIDSFPIPKSFGAPGASFEAMAHAITLVNAYFESQHGGIRIAQQNWPVEFFNAGRYYSNGALINETTYTDLIHPAIWEVSPGFNAINGVFVFEAGPDTILEVKLTVRDQGTPATLDENENSVVTNTASLQPPEEILELSGFRDEIYMVPIRTDMVNTAASDPVEILFEAIGYLHPRSSNGQAPFRPVWLEIFASEEF